MGRPLARYPVGHNLGNNFVFVGADLGVLANDSHVTYMHLRSVEVLSIKLKSLIREALSILYKSEKIITKNGCENLGLVPAVVDECRRGEMYKQST